MSLTHITKRDGRKVKFEREKIKTVILKAAKATGEFGEKEADKLTEAVVSILKNQFSKDKIPHVENVQDTVEYILVKEDRYATAKAFILFREKRKQIREARKALGIEDDIGLSINTLKVLERRYLLHGEDGQVAETPREMFVRVAKSITKAERKYSKSKRKIKEWEDKFLGELISLRFLPGGRILRNAGTSTKCLSNCFVLPVEDSMKDIFDAVKFGALIHKVGGGTGYNFSKLRPRGDRTAISGGYASGPTNFMEAFDTMCRVVSSGGLKRGAMMGMLNISHPDIIDFITSKQTGQLQNFNISVGASDKFMSAVEKGQDFNLVNPRTCQEVHTVKANELMHLITSQAWSRGDPGMVYLDALQNGNTLRDHEVIDAVNVCGEIPLPSYDACNLGSLNLAKFVREEAADNKKTKRKIDWDALEESIIIATRFMDNAIDINRFPIRQITKSVKEHRRIGLGVMGFAELLFLLHIPYASNAGLKVAEKIMRFIKNTSYSVSEELAKERGTFPLWKKSVFAKQKKKMRNCALNAIAPTGGVSLIPEVTGGIEPVFALAFTNQVVEETGLFYVNKVFEQVAREEGFYSEELIEQIARKGSLTDIKGVPKWAKEVFTTAHDIAPEWHIKMQAAFQKHIDNAVSKTVNLPHDATIDDVHKMYMLAWKLKCKGVTIYRDKSLEEQILNVGKNEEDKKGPKVQSTTKITPLNKRTFNIKKLLSKS